MEGSSVTIALRQPAAEVDQSGAAPSGEAPSDGPNMVFTYVAGTESRRLCIARILPEGSPADRLLKVSVGDFWERVVLTLAPGG